MCHERFRARHVSIDTPPSLLEESIERRLCDRFVNLGLGAAGGNASNGLAVDFYGQSTLVGEKIWERQDLHVPPLHGISPFFRGTLVKLRVPGLFLCELNRVQGGAVCLFQKM